MKTLVIVPLVAAWIAMGVLSAGFVTASFKTEFCGYDFYRNGKDGRDIRTFMLVGFVGGPMALVASLVFTGGGYDGWSLQRCELSR